MVFANKKRPTAFCLTVSLSLLLFGTACAPVIKTRGNLLKDYQLARVQEGIDTRSDILKKLGSPTTIAPFNENIWFYMGQRTSKKGIFDPKVIDERIVLAKFDDTGVLETIMEVDQDRLNIPLSDDKTPTGGLDVTVMQQLLGNLGKFNAPEGSAGPGI